MKMYMVTLSLLVGPMAVSCSPAAGALSQLKQTLTPNANPLGMDKSYLRHFESLPLSGSVAAGKQPWSDFSWPSNAAGIANRWTSDEMFTGFEYDLYSFDDVSSMPREEKIKLSPAEKFDIYTAQYDYPTVASEWERNYEGAEDDEGLRNGWAAASLNFLEPKAVKVMSEDGVEIEFHAADVKALLSYYQGQIAYSRTVQLGEKCRVNFDQVRERACKETNPGAFHMVLANELGRHKSGFILDAKKEDAPTSWNSPVHGFTAKLVQDNLPPSPFATAGTRKEVEIEAVVTVSDTGLPQHDATNGTEFHNDVTIVYKYRLELDARGYILGGTWLGQERPDSMWRQDKPLFERDFLKLQTLYEASIK